MQNQNYAISYDFQKDKVSQANTAESLGMALMRLAAKATRHRDYTGLAHANRLISSILPSKRFVRTRLFDDTSFEFPYGDGYWGVLLDNTIPYSVSEEYFLSAIRDIDYAFIDCGANFGYMSSIVTSQEYGQKPSIAIEADPNTFQMLERNWNLNDQRFEIRHNAVFSKSGETVRFGGGKHEARAIQDSANEVSGCDVETIALNDLQPWIEKQNRKHLILKLDVEGVEIPALNGAKELMQRNPLVLFEDHASDKSHEVSRFIMEEFGMDIFYSDENGCRQVFTLDDINAIKRNPRVGYDFIAVTGEFWPGVLRGIEYK